MVEGEVRINPGSNDLITLVGDISVPGTGLQVGSTRILGKGKRVFYKVMETAMF